MAENRIARDQLVCLMAAIIYAGSEKAAPSPAIVVENAIKLLKLVDEKTSAGELSP